MCSVTPRRRTCCCYCRDPEPFDWYQRYSGLKDLVGQYMKADDHILMIGCGNSRTFTRLFVRRCSCAHMRRACAWLDDGQWAL